MTRTLSIAAATLKDTSPPATVEVAATAGFNGAGIWFEPATWTDAVSREVRRRLDDTGLIALDMEPVILTESGDPGDRLVAAAAAVGARHVLVASRISDHGAVADRFAQLCQQASLAGVTVVLEFLPVFGVRTLGQAVAIVEEAAQPNSGVLVDSLHLARSGASVAEVAALPVGLFPYLQVADAPAEAPDPSMAGLLDEAINGRSLPGTGGLPLAELVDTVPGVPLSAELRSAQLLIDFPDPVERARAVLAACRPLAER